MVICLPRIITFHRLMEMMTIPAPPQHFLAKHGETPANFGQSERRGQCIL